MKKPKYPTGGNIRNYIQMPNTVLEERQRILDMKKAEVDSQMQDLNLIFDGVSSIIGAASGSMGSGQSSMPVKNMGQQTAASQFCFGGKKKAFGGGVDNPPSFKELYEKYTNGIISDEEMGMLSELVNKDNADVDAYKSAVHEYMKPGNIGTKMPQWMVDKGLCADPYNNNCIASVTGARVKFGQEPIYGNELFASNYEKYGYRKRNPEEGFKPGDVGQAYYNTSEKKKPFHAFFVANEEEDWYSPGGSAGANIIKSSKNPNARKWRDFGGDKNLPGGTDYYEYVGPYYKEKQNLQEGLNRYKNTLEQNQFVEDMKQFQPKKTNINNVTGFYPFAFGGNAMQNIEIEGGETVETPDGKVTRYMGPSHEQGGIDLTVPEGTMISSDRLIDPKTGMTFSDKRIMMEKEIQKLESKLDKLGSKALERKHDNVAKNTIDRKTKSYTQKLDNLNKEKEEDMRIQDSFNKAANTSLVGFGSFPYGGTSAGMTPLVIPDEYFDMNNVSPDYKKLNPEQKIDLFKMMVSNKPQLTEQEQSYLSKWKEMDLQKALIGHDQFPYGGQLSASMTPFTIPDEYFQNLGIDITSPYFTELSQTGRMGLVNAMTKNREKTPEEKAFDYKFKQSELQKATTGFDELYGRKYPTGGYVFKGTDINSKYKKYYKYDESTGTWYTVDMKNSKDMPAWDSDVWGKRNDTDYLNSVFLKEGKLNPDYEKYITKYTYREDVYDPNFVIPPMKKIQAKYNGDPLLDDLGPRYRDYIPYDPNNKQKKENMDPITLGEGLGIAGAAVSGLGPLLTTLGAKDKLLEKNPNFFQNFGKDAIKANEDAQDYVARIRDNMLMRLEQEQRSQMASNRNSARGINTQRALDLGTYMASNQGANEIANNEALQMMQLLSQKSQLENVQDQYTMQGALMADTANRQDLASYYSNLANNWVNAGSALQNVGANLNMSKEDDFLDLLPLLNENGLTFTRENGKLKIVKINEG